MHDHEPKPKVIALIDTIVTCGLLFMLPTFNQNVILLMAVSVAWTVMIAWHYISEGLYVGIRELVYFYIEIAYWEVITGRTPHDRIHPKHASSSSCPVCSHESEPVRSIGQFIVFQLIGIPMFLSVVILKASALIFGPLIYIGFAFRTSDFLSLSHTARKQYRSSFKHLWILVAVVGIIFFALKFFVYGYWNYLAGWWNAQPYLIAITPFVYPPAFLPFHFTSFLSSVLLLVGVAMVDVATYRIDTLQEQPAAMPTLLRSITAVGRVRLVLSVYTWICILWISVPFLRSLRFPPISLELFPR